MLQGDESHDTITVSNLANSIRTDLQPDSQVKSPDGHALEEVIVAVLTLASQIHQDLAEENDSTSSSDNLV